MAANELPDFLPLFLEYLSTRPVEEACELLGEPLHILTVIEERLHKRKSIYVGVLRALLVLARGGADATKLAELRAVEDDDPADLEALDRAWAEEPVMFGPDQDAGCGKSSILRRLAAGARPGARSETKESQR